MAYTVSRQDELLAIEYGVALVYLDTSFMLAGHSRPVIAISMRTGNSIRRGNLLWVRSELDKMSIKVVKEF